MVDIIKIVNTKDLGAPFGGVMRKLDSQISNRSRFQLIQEQLQFSVSKRNSAGKHEIEVARTPPPDPEPLQLEEHNEEVFLASPQTELLSSGAVPDPSSVERPTVASKIHLQKEVALPRTKPCHRYCPSSDKEIRIEGIKSKMDELADMLAMRRTNLIKAKWNKALDHLNNLKLKDLYNHFKKLRTELSDQPVDQLSSKRLKANYFTTMKFLKSSVPTAVDKCSALIDKFIILNAFEDIKSEAVCKVMKEKSIAIILQVNFKRLKDHTEEQKRKRTEDKLLMFLMKLDTALLLFKYNSFFKIVAVAT